MTEVRRTKSPIRTDGALSNLRHERHGTSALAYTAVRCNTVLMTQNYSIDENRDGDRSGAKPFGGAANELFLKKDEKMLCI